MRPCEYKILNKHPSSSTALSLSLYYKKLPACQISYVKLHQATPGQACHPMSSNVKPCQACQPPKPRRFKPSQLSHVQPSQTGRAISTQAKPATPCPPGPNQPSHSTRTKPPTSRQHVRSTTRKPDGSPN